MRVIAGSLKGKKLAPLSGLAIRPTADRVREAIFNICAAHISDATILDLFSGTGAFSIESLSRGAGSAVAIDSSVRATAVIQKNITACRLNEQVKIIKWDIVNNLNCLRGVSHRFDLVFMDPPYNKNAVRPALENLAACGALADEALIIVEHAPAESIPGDLSGFELIDQRKYGKTLVSFITGVINI